MLVDFGLSTIVRTEVEGRCEVEELCVTQCGSPAYAAPELLSSKKYGSKVDIWSM
jgi:Neu-associated kinase